MSTRFKLGSVGSWDTIKATDAVLFEHERNHQVKFEVMLPGQATITAKTDAGVVLVGEGSGHVKVDFSAVGNCEIAVHGLPKGSVFGFRSSVKDFAHAKKAHAEVYTSFDMRSQGSSEFERMQHAMQMNFERGLEKIREEVKRQAKEGSGRQRETARAALKREK